ncbi:LuxR C-terminal-related transcriptional regulator [Algirhabdus cladophorae]|uniref:LuxR C-terminal-related transcriptional regulator n=1 Tax=Algirhabdus cladophorae TaxID=3377108 RepID=UPI003B84A573
MSADKDPDLTPDGVVDQLYDIALDPGSLDQFIDVWNTAGLDAGEARRMVEEIDQFDAAFHHHLKRAETFLHRNSGQDSAALSDALAPFENLAALILDRSFQVVACNAGAQQSFGLSEGSGLQGMPLSGPARAEFENTLSALAHSPAKSEILLNLTLDDAQGSTLFHIRRLANTGPDNQVMMLIVTTQYHWQPVLGKTLEDVFKLTLAEIGVVRALIEGMDAKTIASDRGTSEGTVRSQIKSILSKMNARSQSEVIRLVLSLREVTQGAQENTNARIAPAQSVSSDWLDSEVWKPFKTLTLPDGRRMDYHDMGPVTGAPILFSHMGYCMARWSAPMITMAFQHGLRIICPIRAGYGQSENIDPKGDVIKATREDTLALLEHLDIKRLPYVIQGNDLLCAVDLAAKRPDIVSEIIGLGARPCLPGDQHYAEMGKWHRFFLSTAKHSPHLLTFTVKAAVSMTKRVGVVEMFKHFNKYSAADMALLDDPYHLPILIANAQLTASKNTNVAQAYIMEVLASESDWSDRMLAAKNTPTWFVNGIEDPSTDVATIALYRETYPWIDIEVVQNAGQMLIYQHYETLIPQFAKAARAALDA